MIMVRVRVRVTGSDVPGGLGEETMLPVILAVERRLHREWRALINDGVFIDK